MQTIERIARTEKFEISTATAAEREAIYRLRHNVYAVELGQHRPNAAKELRDPLDHGNVYLVARAAGGLAGFISITRPQQGSYSIDKYFRRDELPFAIDDSTYEVRLLTVLEPFRNREFASLLMYAAFRWIEAHGGRQMIAIGRREVLSIYLKGGLRHAGLSTKSGAVAYDLLHASVAQVRENLANLGGLLARVEGRVDWKFSFPFHRPANCFHGGEFFHAIGENFDDLSRRQKIINADVLDAWFPPAPEVEVALREDLNWLLRTSPPTQCSGLIETIAQARGVRPENILPGAGSSDLMFRALRHWLNSDSRVLILDPMYGEYAHILERVIGCMVDRLTLRRSENYEVNLDRLRAALRDEYDLVILVNPNSPTGRHIEREMLEAFLKEIPEQTRVWIDETYIEYVGSSESVEHFAAQSENVVVCKSMSKVYALSGARAAYLCGGAHQLESLRAITPPWVIGLPTQLAAVRALQNPVYYAARYATTHFLREELRKGLEAFGWEIVPGRCSFLLCHLPSSGPQAAELVARCRARGLYLRNATLMGSTFGESAIRIAVKDRDTNQRMLQIITEALETNGKEDAQRP